MPNGHGPFEVKDESFGVATTEQFLTEREMGEVQRLMRCLNSLKDVKPDPVKLFDSNGEPVGTLTIGTEGYYFGYYMQEEINE